MKTRPPSTQFFEQVYALVRSVPRGRVTTYGAIARVLGPGVSAREVGRALASLPNEHNVPTHRVVSAQGAPLCKRGLGSPGDQRALLEAEGVQFDHQGRVQMASCFWQPGSE